MRYGKPKQQHTQPTKEEKEGTAAAGNTLTVAPTAHRPQPTFTHLDKSKPRHYFEQLA
ncbi:hypothetical protein BKA80DRAFT_124427 [Phyllosticta citrichinensis]